MLRRLEWLSQERVRSTTQRQGSFSHRCGLIFSEISTSRPSCSFTSETKVPQYPVSAQNFWIDSGVWLQTLYLRGLSPARLALSRAGTPSQMQAFFGLSPVSLAPILPYFARFCFCFNAFQVVEQTLFTTWRKNNTRRLTVTFGGYQAAYCL